MSTSIGTTILEQLGGNRFLAMTGAKNLIFSDATKSLYITISGASTKHRINKVQIKLMPNDTYQIRAFRVRNFKATEISVIDDVYCDMLQDAFTSITGLYTRL